MEKEIEYKVQRTLSAFPIERDYHAYREVLNFGSFGTQVNEGIARLSDLESLEGNEPLPKCDYYLYPKEYLEFHRQATLDESSKKASELYIKEPYTHIEKNGLDGMVLIKPRAWYDRNVYDLDDIPYPRGVHFEYITPGLHDGNYDLEHLLSVLSSRLDVRFLKEGIIDIEYYNRDRYHTKYLDFVWIPSDEDWDKFKDRKDTSYQTFYHDIVKEIFGIDKKPDAGYPLYDEDEDEDDDY